MNAFCHRLALPISTVIRGALAGTGREFALGLGPPVIWLCREDALAKVHFDNRQCHFILWKPEGRKTGNGGCKTSIEATLGHEPLASAAVQVSG